jgi:hypothetical protein
MSSTNRSAAREKHVSDYYVTPLHTIREFLEAFNKDVSFGQDEPMMILDPCAGGDATNPMAYPNAITNYSGWNVGQIHTIDIRPDSKAMVIGDYLQMTSLQPGDYEMALTNPPFNIAMDVINKCLTEVKPGGWVIMLLRLNFFGSKERQGFWQKNMPMLTYVHTKRPKFLNTGGTDSIEYAHCCWQVGNPCKFTKLRII